MDTDEIYRLLKSGSLKERKSFFQGLRLPIPASRITTMLSMDPDEFLAAFLPLVISYCEVAEPDKSAALAEAAHHYAIDVYQNPLRRKISPGLLIDIAHVSVTAMKKLGRSNEVIEFGKRWEPFYVHLGKEFDVSQIGGRSSELFSIFGDSNQTSQTAGSDLFGIGNSTESRASDFLGADASPQIGWPTLDVKHSEPVLSRARPPAYAEEPVPLESPDRKAPPPVATGFVHIASPEAALDTNEPILPDERYFFWLEIADVVGSIEEKPTPLPVDLLPVSAKLTVVLFAPDSGISVEQDADVGELQLQSDGTATVIVQPMKKDTIAPEGLLVRRLLFPVRTHSTPGNYRLRCSVYCHGVLIQSRIIHVRVGGIERVSRVDYTLATRLNTEKLETLTEHRFSMHVNAGPASSHDFYFYGAPEGKPYNKAININANKLEGLLQAARAALQRASWGDEEPWQAGKPYRYGKTNLDTLRQDLAVLAIAGYRIFDEIANQLAGGKENVLKLRELVAEPGLVQISADAELGMVLPAALIYDYKISLRIPPAKFKLCPEFERAFKNKIPLTQTACFQGHCPSKAEDSAVCPSGFWGFRHALGLPFSNVEAGDDKKTGSFETRIEYSDIPVLIVGVSKAPDLPRTKTHTKELLELRPDWGERAWLVRDSLDPLLYAMRSGQPHLVYMYCHGSGRPVGSAEIPMLYFGANPQAPQPGEWLEKATLRDEIEWSQPRPLVFLNGCHTTKLSADTILDFVTGFVQNANACGVVGTEITVFEELAGAFATRFIKRFLGGQIVGQAIRDARLDLLQEGNPLGLVYTPFVLSGTQLVKVEKN